MGVIAPGGATACWRRTSSSCSQVRARGRAQLPMALVHQLEAPHQAPQVQPRRSRPPCRRGPRSMWAMGMGGTCAGALRPLGRDVVLADMRQHRQQVLRQGAALGITATGAGASDGVAALGEGSNAGTRSRICWGTLTPHRNGHQRYRTRARSARDSRALPPHSSAAPILRARRDGPSRGWRRSAAATRCVPRPPHDVWPAPHGQRGSARNQRVRRPARTSPRQGDVAWSWVGPGQVRMPGRGTREHLRQYSTRAIQVFHMPCVRHTSIIPLIMAVARVRLKSDRASRRFGEPLAPIVV